MEQYIKEKMCICGKEHFADIDDVCSGKNAISRLGDYVRKYAAKRPFLLADKNTFAAAGEKVCQILDSLQLPYSSYIFQCDNLEPNEETVGSMVMHYDVSCDLIIAIGSGVINDIGKILSCTTGNKYIIVATAPSVDGYASATSSMAMDGLKVSLNTRCADVIIGDTDILKTAPDRMLQTGLGDMLAKYVSIAEWRIGNLITGEYYCDKVAQLVRIALKKCVDNAEGLLKREDAAIEAVFEGLVISGVMMTYAGISRPASGVEHYFSHIWDMRALEFGTKADLHGIQCAWGTLQAVKLYEAVKIMTPNVDAAKAYIAAFSYEDWKAELRKFLGNSAETMIQNEAREQKFDKSKHGARLAKIQENWDVIIKILDEELPSYEALAAVMKTVGMPLEPACIDVDRENIQMTFKATKDIRDKYVLSTLAWDLGILEDLCELL